MENKYSKVCVLILSYEPVPVLIDVAKGAYEAGFNVLIVNDGSNEKFNPIFEECEKYATVLSYKKNHGKGYAIRYGVSYLLTKKEMKYVITVDGDGQHLIGDVIRTANTLLEENKIVITVRDFGGSHVPARSKFGNGWSKLTQSLMTGKFLQDNQCGLRGFVLADSEWLLQVNGNRYEYEMNVITYICMHDFDYIQLVIDTVYEKGNPTSHFKPFVDTMKIQAIILKSGFFSLLAIIIQCLLGFFLNKYFIEIIDFSEIGSFFISFLSAFIFAYLFSSITNTLVFWPRRRMYHMMRLFILDFGEAVLMTGLMFLFFYFLKWNYFLAYLLSFIICMVPTYFFVKWINAFLNKPNIKK